MKRSSSGPKPASAFVIEPGAVLGGRVRLDQSIASWPQGEIWSATDLETRARHGVEFVSHKHWLTLLQPDALIEELKQALPARHPDLLAFYRIAGAWPELAIVTAPYPVLRQKPLLAETDWRAFELKTAVDWINSVGHVLQELHEAGLRPYGSLVPSRIVIRANGLPLVTGYPQATYRDPREEQAFLSPARHNAKPPELADDIFGLGALAYFILCGGASPPTFKEAPALENSIDRVREGQGLAPTGWAQGWDLGVLSALRENPSERPLSIRALVNSLNNGAGRPKLSAALRRIALPPLASGSAEISRRLPPWRTSSLAHRNQGRVVPTTQNSETPAGSDSPFHAAVRLREDKAALAGLSDDLRQSQATLLNDIAHHNTQRAELDRRAKTIEQETAELKAARQELENARRTLSENTARLEAEKQTLDQQGKATKAADEALQAEKESLARKNQDVELLTRSLVAQKSRLAKDQEKVAQADDVLKAKSVELERREKTLTELQQTLTLLSGGAGANQWQAFVQQLSATKREQEQRALKLAAEEKRLEALRSALAEAKTKSSSTEPDLKKLGSEPDALEIARLLPLSESSGPENKPSSHETASPILATPPPPPVVPPVPEFLKASLVIGGRRLHIFAGPKVRFGRLGNSDMMLFAILAGQTQPSLSLNREISRKHFELSISTTEAQVIDGWSDDNKPSQHGVCVDGRRVPPSGAVLRTGMLLSVTTRAPARSVPHWRVLVSPRPEQATPSTAPPPPVSAVFLQRLDDAPDDILVLLSSIALKDLGLADPTFQNVSLQRHPQGFAWEIGSQITPFDKGPTPVPGINLASLGFISTSASVPAA